MIRSWQDQLEDALENMLTYYDSIAPMKTDHIEATPQRVVRMYEEMFSGYKLDTKKLLSSALFGVTESERQMIHVEDIQFYSMCAHHLLPIMGRAHFAYIPRESIVGLSKIPRLVVAFSRRLQVQEELTSQIVDAFMEVVKPSGCGLMMVARHGCMECRGIQATTARMRTTALRGNFLTEDRVRTEFMNTAALNRWE